MPTDSKTIDWLLRIAVAIQCAGYAWLIGVVGESPLMSWLWEPHDVGGLALGELRSAVIVKVVAGFLVVAAVSTLFHPSRLLLVGVAAFQIVLAVATWQTYSGYPLDVSWLGRGPARDIAGRLVPLFPFVTGAARIASPLVLLMVHWSRLRTLLGVAISPLTEWTMRIALALTFSAHGLESLDRRGSFLDMLILATRNLLGMRMPETTAHWLLAGIGIADLTVAVLVVAIRSRGIALYMAIWGFITAAARLVVLNPEVGSYEFAIRASHWALPLVLLLAWRVARPPAALLE